MLLGVCVAVLAAQVMGQSTNQCEKPLVSYVRTEEGRQAVIRIPGKSPNYNITVRLHAPWIDDQSKIVTSSLEQDGENSSRIKFRVRIFSQLPNTKVVQVIFNGQVLCKRPESSTGHWRTISRRRGNPPYNSIFPQPANMDVVDDDRATKYPPTNKPQPTRPPQDQCGVTFPSDEESTVALALQGKPTEKEDWPWLAALSLKKNKKFFCGSSLISKTHLISAAHCMFDKSMTQWPSNSLIVGVGWYDISNKYEEMTQFKEIRKVVIHEEYNPKRKTLENDIVVIHLKEPVEYSSIVQPICLYPDNDNLDDIVGHQAYVVGWGATEHTLTRANPTPLLVELPIVSDRECADTHNNLNVTFNPALQICAGERKGKGPCVGDSGGALMFKLDHDDGPSRWYLRGIVSFIPKGNSKICHLNNFSVFTDASKYYNWILSAL